MKRFKNKVIMANFTNTLKNESNVWSGKDRGGGGCSPTSSSNECLFFDFSDHVIIKER